MMKKNFFAFLSLITYHLSHPISSVFAQEPGAWEDLIPGQKYRCVNEDGVATIQGFECIFINIVRVLVPLVGLAFFVMLIAGAFQMMTAGGDPKAIQKARATLTAAIAGLVLFFGIWFILLLIKTITGVDVTEFVIPS